MIKRITNPEEFSKVIDDLNELFLTENFTASHPHLFHNPETIKNCFANKYLLAWDFFVWANVEEGKHDAMIAFVNDNNPKFGRRIFSEFLWLSKNPKVGFKLFREAEKFAKEQDFGVIAMSLVDRTPQSYQLRRLYGMLGFEKDCEVWTKEL